MNPNAEFKVISAESSDQLEAMLNKARLALIKDGRKISSVQMTTTVNWRTHGEIWGALITHVPFHSLGE